MDQDGVNKLAESLSVVLEKGTGFIEEQAPQLINEIVMYGRMTTTIDFVLSAVFMFLFCGITYFCVRNFVKQELAESMDTSNKGFVLGFTSVIVGVPSFVIALVSLIALCGSVTPLVTAWFCPNIYVMEFLGKLVN